MQTHVKKQFSYSTETLNLLANIADNHKRYSSLLPELRDNLFIYGIEGGTALDMGERRKALYLLDRVKEVLAIAYKWSKEGDEWALYNCAGYIFSKSTGRRYTDTQLLSLIFETSYFWEYKVSGAVIDPVKSVSLIQLLDTFLTLSSHVQEDYERYMAAVN